MTCPFYIQCFRYGKIVEILFYCNWLEHPKHFSSPQFEKKIGSRLLALINKVVSMMEKSGKINGGAILPSQIVLFSILLDTWLSLYNNHVFFYEIRLLKIYLFWEWCLSVA